MSPAFCRQLIDEAQLSTKQKHLTIEFTSVGELGDALWDESLLRHILGNLLGNAIKYSLLGGKVQFDLIVQEKTVTFRIQDWGIGIPQQDLPQLFQPFHRADNVGGIPGTGLGLAIVKKCVEAHGGEIRVNSQEGVGTTFTVTLPVMRTQLASILRGRTKRTVGILSACTTIFLPLPTPQGCFIRCCLRFVKNLTQRRKAKILKLDWLLLFWSLVSTAIIKTTCFYKSFSTCNQS